MQSVTSNAVAVALNGKVNFLGSFSNLSLNQIFDTYAQQATVMNMGFLDWQDSRCPTNDTCIITCTDWNMTADSLRGERFYYDRNNQRWVYITETPINISVPCSYKGIININKYQKVVQVNYFETDNTTFNFGTENQWNVIATIPEGFRPRETIYLSDQGQGRCFYLQVNADGNIYGFKVSTASPGWEIAFNVTYVI